MLFMTLQIYVEVGRFYHNIVNLMQCAADIGFVIAKRMEQWRLTVYMAGLVASCRKVLVNTG